MVSSYNHSIVYESGICILPFMEMELNLEFGNLKSGLKHAPYFCMLVVIVADMREASCVGK